MRYLQIIMITLCLFSFWDQSYSQQSPFGLGISIGEPAGINAKLWTSPTTAFDFGLGWSIGGDRIGLKNVNYNGESRIHLHFDYLVHVFNAVGTTEQYPIYYGFGARFNTGGGYYNSFAMRFVVGLAWMPRSMPIDMFVEFVPSLQLTAEPGFAIDAAIGARYYF